MPFHPNKVSEAMLAIFVTIYFTTYVFPGAENGPAPVPDGPYHASSIFHVYPFPAVRRLAVSWPHDHDALGRNSRFHVYSTLVPSLPI